MGAASKLEDISIMSNLSPLNRLERGKLQELASKSVIREFKSGELVFKAGDNDNHLVYLLSGAIDFMDKTSVVEKITAQDKRCREPIVQAGERQYTAKVKAAGTTVLFVDAGLYDFLANWSDGGGLQVDEIQMSEGGDWMGGILMNQGLLKLPPDSIQALMSCVEPVEFKNGETVVKQGEIENHYYIITKGRCSVSRRPEKGAPEVQLAVLGPGEAFGEEALIANNPRSATVRMLEDGQLLRLKHNDFMRLIKGSFVKYLTYNDAMALKDKGGVVLDIRDPEVAKKNPLGINMPLAVVRQKEHTLDRGKKYIAVCEDGKKSSVAAFLLSQKGLVVYVLKDGVAGQRSDAQPGGATAKSAEAPPAPANDPLLRAERKFAEAMFYASNLEKERDKLQDEIATLKKEIDYIKYQQDLAEERATKSGQSADGAAQEQAQKLQNELTQAQSAQDKLRAEMQQLQAVFATYKAQAEAEKQALRGELQAEANGKAGQLQQKERELDAATQREREAQAKVQALEARIAAMVGELASAQRNEQGSKEQSMLLAEKESRVAELEARSDALNEQLAREKGRVAELQKQLDDERRQAKLLAEGQTAADQEKDALAAQLAQAKSQVEEQAARYGILKAEMSQKIGALDAQYQEALKAKDAERAAALAAYGPLQDKNTALAAQIEQLQRDHATRQREIADLNATIAEINALADTAGRESAVLKAQAAAHLARIGELETRFAAERAELETVRVTQEQELEALRKQAGSAQSVMAEADAKIQAAAARHAEELGRLNASLAELASQSAAYKAQIAVLEQSIAQRSEAVTALENKHQELEHKVAALSGEAQVLRQDLSRAREELGVKRDEAAKLEQRLQESEQARNNAVQWGEFVEKAREALTKENQQLTFEVQKLKAKAGPGGAAADEAEIEEYRATIDKLEHELKSRAQQVAGLESNAADLSRKLEQAEQQWREAQARTAAGAREDIEAARAAWQEKLDHERARADAALQAKRELELDFEFHRNEAETAKQKLADAVAELKELRKQRDVAAKAPVGNRGDDFSQSLLQMRDARQDRLKVVPADPPPAQKIAPPSEPAAPAAERMQDKLAEEVQLAELRARFQKSKEQDAGSGLFAKVKYLALGAVAIGVAFGVWRLVQVDANLLNEDLKETLVKEHVIADEAVAPPLAPPVPEPVSKPAAKPAEAAKKPVASEARAPVEKPVSKVAPATSAVAAPKQTSAQPAAGAAAPKSPGAPVGAPQETAPRTNSMSVAQPVKPAAETLPPSAPAVKEEIHPPKAPEAAAPAPAAVEHVAPTAAEKPVPAQAVEEPKGEAAPVEASAAAEPAAPKESLVDMPAYAD
ncbi:MAG: cyclic nucleotide-binding domain-containing protein [Pseudomonadota bacterium]